MKKDLFKESYDLTYLFSCDICNNCFNNCRKCPLKGELVYNWEEKMVIARSVSGVTTFAKCHPKDTFSPSIGKQVALLKMFNIYKGYYLNLKQKEIKKVMGIGKFLKNKLSETIKGAQ